MPDHFHLLWMGLSPQSDQLLASRSLRRESNRLLRQSNASLQREAFDHVLRREERDRSAVQAVAAYIALNPERAGIVANDGHRDYSYTGCVLPGYPELELWRSDSWDRIWRCCSHLRKHGVVHAGDPTP